MGLAWKYSGSSLMLRHNREKASFLMTRGFFGLSFNLPTGIYWILSVVAEICSIGSSQVKLISFRSRQSIEWSNYLIGYSLLEEVRNAEDAKNAGFLS